MEGILKALNIAVEEAQKLNNALLNAVNYANNIEKESELKMKAADDKEAANTITAANLTERESKIAKLENIVKLENDGRILAKQNQEMAARFEAKEQAFKGEVAKKLKEIGAGARKNADDKEMLDKEYAGLRKEQAAFKIEKEKMRENILKELKALK